MLKNVSLVVKLAIRHERMKPTKVGLLSCTFAIMIKCIPLALGLIFAFTLSGQHTSVVSGQIVEATTQDHLEFVDVMLIQLPDSSLILTTVTNHKGAFQFENLRPGNYLLEARLTGFETNQIPSFQLIDETTFSLGVISLTASEFTLDQIEVNANNPAFVNAPGMKIYYTGQDIQAQSGSISDVLQNIPSVTVEAEGEILLRGSANITFLLNGKTSGLLKNNPSLILEQIPAHTIERIEIITNPSAKYKPDGTAGIINIVTKKNIVPGLNGNILANASTNRRYNGNVSLNYNPGKFNISILTGYWQNYSPRTFTDFRIYQDSFSGLEKTFDLKNNAIGKSKSYTTTLNMDYAPDEKNSFGLSGSIADFNSQRDNTITTLETIETGIFNDFYTQRKNHDDETELEIAGYAEHFFKKEDHSISFEAAYGNYDDWKIHILLTPTVLPHIRHMKDTTY